MKFVAHSEEEVETMLASLRGEHPEMRVQALHVTGRVVEAGLEVTVQGPGCHAVITLDPSADPEASFATLAHVSESVFAAMTEMVEAMTEEG